MAENREKTVARKFQIGQERRSENMLVNSMERAKRALLSIHHLARRSVSAGHPKSSGRKLKT
jgi:hypothetical protein